VLFIALLALLFRVDLGNMFRKRLLNLKKILSLLKNK